MPSHSSRRGWAGKFEAHEGEKKDNHFQRKSPAILYIFDRSRNKQAKRRVKTGGNVVPGGKNLGGRNRISKLDWRAKSLEKKMVIRTRTYSKQHRGVYGGRGARRPPPLGKNGLFRYRTEEEVALALCLLQT